MAQLRRGARHRHGRAPRRRNAVTVAVVTGAASGMGRACVEHVRGLADVVVAADLSAPDIVGTTGVACDVSDRDAVRALADEVRGLGPFRALAHAAGVSPTM